MSGRHPRTAAGRAARVAGRARPPVAGDAGITLVEVLIAVALLGIGVIALMSAVVTTVSTTTWHRKAATVDTVIRDYSEALKLKVSATTGTGWCQATPYTGLSYSAPSGYSASQTSVGTCPATTSTTPQYQTITVTAASTDGKDSETVRIVVRPTCPRTSC